MKKTCNRCGHQLDIGKRNCTSCGAFNPYFIAGYTAAAVDDTTEILKKQQLEAKKIETELAEKKKQEQKARELESAQKQWQKPLKEKTIKAAAKPQYEIPDSRKNVSFNEPADEHKTFFFLHEKPDDSTGKTWFANYISSVPDKRKMAIAAALLVISLCSFTYLYFSKPSPVKSVPVAENVTPAGNDANSTAARVSNAVENTPVVKKPLKAIAVSSKKDIEPATAAKFRHAGEFNLTLYRVKKDLVGKRLSGCGITIRKASDILNLGDLVFIEQLPSGYMKYKVAAKVQQGGYVYNSTPYVYYNAEGTFVKVDGTNCE